MKKTTNTKFIITLLVLFTGFSTLAQKPLLEYAKTYGSNNNDGGKAIKATSDGGYITAGYTLYNNGDVHGAHGGVDCWVIKFDSDGDTSWTYAIGGPGNDDAEDIIEGSDGNFYGVGYSHNTGGNVKSNNGAADLFVFKISSSGILLETNSFGGNSNEHGNSIIENNDGNLVVVAYTTSNNNGDVPATNGNQDYWIVELNKRYLTIDTSYTFGGTNADRPYDIIQTKDKGYLISGENIATVFPGYNFDVMKLDSTFTKEWQKSLGGNANDHARSAVQTLDGGYAIAGFTTSPVTGYRDGYDFYVVKLDSTGKVLWSKPYGSTANDLAYAIQEDSDSTLLVVGESGRSDGDVSVNNGNQDFWLIKLSDTGTLLWDFTYGGSHFDIPQDFVITDDGYMINGYSASNNVNGFRGAIDVRLVKLVLPVITPVADFSASKYTTLINECIDFTDQSKNKPIIWSWSFPNATTTSSSDQNPTGICYTTPGDYTVTLTAINSKGSHSVTKTIVVQAVPIADFSQSKDLIDINECVTYTDDSEYEPTSWTWIFEGGDPLLSSDQNPVEVCYKNVGEYSVTLIATNATGSDTATKTILVEDFASVHSFNSSSFKIHPNPAINKVTVEWEGFQTGTLSVVDLNGKVVYTGQYNGNNHVLDISQLAKGAYIINISGENGIFSERFFKQ